MPFLNSFFACSSQDDKDNNVTLKLNTMSGDIKSIEKDISNIRLELVEIKCEMRIGFSKISNQLEILLSRK